MLNLYEILEVNEKASKEIIEKAYKVLAKKYHPDLQTEDNKEKAEEKMKQLNEAYEILIDDEKRKQYDLELQTKRDEELRKKLEEEIEKNAKKSEQTINNIAYQEQEIKKYEDNIIKEDETDIVNNQKRNIEILQNEMKRAYANAYNDHLRNLGYKLKEPWTFKRFVEFLKVLLIFSTIIAIIWFFPPTNKLIVDFYEKNQILQSIVNIITGIVVGLWNGIIKFLKNIF